MKLGPIVRVQSWDHLNISLANRHGSDEFQSHPLRHTTSSFHIHCTRLENLDGKWMKWLVCLLEQVDYSGRLVDTCWGYALQGHYLDPRDRSSQKDFHPLPRTPIEVPLLTGPAHVLGGRWTALTGNASHRDTSAHPTKRCHFHRRMFGSSWSNKALNPIF